MPKSKKQSKTKAKARSVSSKPAAAQKFPVRLLGDRMLVKSFNKEGDATTASGIILPGREGNEKQERGEVIATGPGRTVGEGKRVPMEVKAGDRIIFKRGYDADEIEIGGHEYVLISEMHVLAIESK